VGLDLTQLAWQGKLLEIGNKKGIILFHIKIKHIENCFCSVEQSLPLAKKAKSPAWPLA